MSRSASTHLVSVQSISKAFLGRSLFQGLSLTIDERQRIGLIGPNGAGKSTFLKILAARETPDTGAVVTRKDLRIGFLEQSPRFSEEETIESTLFGQFPDHLDPSDFGKIQEIISKVSLNHLERSTKVVHLSGGWQKRIALARELIKSPELLLLDEPSNHLDVQSIIWLENFLENANFATLTITHDRLLLQRISNRIIELNRRFPQCIFSSDGDYATFLEARETFLSGQLQGEQRLRNTLKRETAWLRSGTKARTTKQQARIQGAHELAEEVSQLRELNRREKIRLEFQPTERTPTKLIEAKAISKSYSGRTVIPTLDCLITAKSRIGLMGSNGCGKSTLIKLLSGETPPDSGSIFQSDSLAVAYFRQDKGGIDLSLTPIQAICDSGDHVEFAGRLVHVRGFLARFLFVPEQMDIPVQRLSGGEQTRLLLAKLILTKANVLVLDEPTNDLDIETLDVLIEVLKEYSGAIILVSHDRHFIDQITQEILTFGIDNDGKPSITRVLGLGQWEAWYQGQTAQLQKSTAEGPRMKRGNAATGEKRPKLTYREQRELDSMESNILKAESRLTAVGSEIEESTNDPNRLAVLAKTLRETQEEINRLYQRWQELTL